MICKVISGFQTGADTGGILAASALDLETGGNVPKDYRDENGVGNKEFMLSMGARPTLLLGYEYRTECNVFESDGTVVFGDRTSPGSRMTSVMVQRYAKPNLWLDWNAKSGWQATGARKLFRDWVEQNGIVVLNCAGNRESRNPGICEAVCEFLMDVLAW